MDKRKRIDNEWGVVRDSLQVANTLNAWGDDNG
jgi:hypothetical protein